MKTFLILFCDYLVNIIENRLEKLNDLAYFKITSDSQIAPYNKETILIFTCRSGSTLGYERNCKSNKHAF